MTDYPPSYPPPPEGGSYPPPPPPGGGSYPPPPPSSGGYLPPAPGTPAYQGYPPASPGTNGMAIAALVCSLVVPFFAPILGIAFGFVALNQIKKTGQSGRGMALAGIIIGAVEIVLSIIWVIFVVIIGVAADKQEKDKQDQYGDHGWGAPASVLVIDYQPVSPAQAA